MEVGTATLGEFEAVLRRARGGDDAAWREIYDLFAPPLLGYLRVRGAPDPDDLLGEVFLQLVRDLDRFEGGEREFKAWTFTVAHHRLLDALRRRRRRPGEDPLDALAGEEPMGNVEEEALSRYESARVLNLIKQLTPDQQSVVLLRIFGDLSVEDVARALRKPPSAVKALQRRALRSLRREILRTGVSE